MNVGERPATGLEDYPELTFVHWEGAIGAQALPNLSWIQVGVHSLSDRRARNCLLAYVHGEYIGWTGARAD